MFGEQKEITKKSESVSTLVCVRASVSVCACCGCEKKRKKGEREKKGFHYNGSISAVVLAVIATCTPLPIG